MKLEELEQKRLQLRQETDKVFHNIDVLAEESRRVASVAHNSESILDNLEYEFEKQTGFNSTDVAFLFLATGLQCARIYLVNNFTKVQKAGNGNKIEKNCINCRIRHLTISKNLNLTLSQKEVLQRTITHH